MVRPSLLRDVASIAFFASEVHGGISTYGAGCPDSRGTPPTLAAAGVASAGGSLALHFDGAVANGSVLVLAGIGQASIPLNPACSLYVPPLFSAMFGPLPLDGVGKLSLQSALPSTLPVPFAITLQAFEIDPLADHGFGSTLGVQITLEASSSGSPYEAHQVVVGADPYGVAIGDLDGDTKVDLIAANFDFHDVSALLRK